MKRNARPAGLTVLGVAIVIVASAYGYLSSASVMVGVQVRSPVLDVDGLGVASVLEVTAENRGRAPVEPSFWVMWSTLSVRGWAIESGPSRLLPGETATFQIRSPWAETAIPNGAVYVVKVLDRISGTYFRSGNLRLELQGIPPIRNAGLGFWARTSYTGQFEPFGWISGSRVGLGDYVSISPANATSGMRVNLSLDGNGGGQTWHHLRQDLTKPDTDRLQNSAVSICWRRAIDFIRDNASGFPITASGVEVALGSRLVWVVPSSIGDEVVDLPSHRIFAIRAPIDSPACMMLPFSSIMDFLGAPGQTVVSFRLLAVAGPSVQGTHVFEVSNITLE